jgi:hypothetical protein
MATLQGVAEEKNSTLTTTIQLELFGSLTVIVFWDDPRPDFLPKEAHLIFSTDKDPKGRFQIAFVYSPERYLHCLEEGLTEDQATAESRRVVDSLEETLNYLVGRSYKWLAPKQIRQEIK